ncbi:MAG TPA: hypothetical protein VGP72_33665 [Planctomycetota bacterium]|jgi:hypothetical protein
MKSATTFAEADALQDLGKFDGAASRAYYSLYQALVPHFEKWYGKPSKLDPRADHWTHDMIRNNCARLVGGDGYRVVVMAFNLRIIADYRMKMCVAKRELDAVMTEIPAVLNKLGVKV